MTYEMKEIWGHPQRARQPVGAEAETPVTQGKPRHGGRGVLAAGNASSRGGPLCAGGARPHAPLHASGSRALRPRGGPLPAPRSVPVFPAAPEAGMGAPRSASARTAPSTERCAAAVLPARPPASRCPGRRAEANRPAPAPSAASTQRVSCGALSALTASAPRAPLHSPALAGSDPQAEGPATARGPTGRHAGRRVLRRASVSAGQALSPWAHWGALGGRGVWGQHICHRDASEPGLRWPVASSTGGHKWGEGHRVGPGHVLTGPT